MSQGLVGRFSPFQATPAEGESIEFKVLLETEDFRRLYWGNSLRLRPFPSLYFYIGFLLVVGFSFYFAWPVGGAFQWVMPIVAGVIDIVAIHAYLGFVAKRTAKGITRRGTSTVQVSSLGIVDRDEHGTQTLAWSVVKKVHNLNEAIYVQFTPGVMIFPLRSFKTQAEKAQVATKMQAWSSATPKLI